MGDDEEVIPALAVSVIPVRPGDGTGVEVFVQHRAQTMDFAAGVVVFPGGRVNAEDHDADEPIPAEVLDRHAQSWHATSIAETEPDVRTMSGVLLACGRREVEEETGWRLRPADLVPWANWVTPPDRPKRFDTYFFLARVGPDDVLAHRTTEADTSEWRAVSSLLADHADGRLRLMRPTLALLGDLGRAAGVDDLTAVPRDIVPHRPQRARPY